MPDPDPRFPEEGPDCETKVVGGHTIYKVGAKQWYSPGAPYDGPFMCEAVTGFTGPLRSLDVRLHASNAIAGGRCCREGGHEAWREKLRPFI